MSGGESFFARWSRQKRNARARSDAKEHPSPSTSETTKSAPPSMGEASPAVPLPPIDSIESASDIKAFLAPGMPPELMRTALRQAWRVDPAIRDFIGLSENAWDFNTPGGVPGFGSLLLEEVGRLVGRFLDEPRVGDLSSTAALVAAGPPTSAQAGPVSSTTQSEESIAAAKHKNELKKGREYCRRRHGGALPQ